MNIYEIKSILQHPSSRLLYRQQHGLSLFHVCTYRFVDSNYILLSPLSPKYQIISSSLFLNKLVSGF